MLILALCDHDTVTSVVNVIFQQPVKGPDVDGSAAPLLDVCR